MTDPAAAGGPSAPRLPVPGNSPPEDISLKTKIRPAMAADLSGCAAIMNAYIDATEWLPRVHAPDVIAAMFTPELLERRRVLVAERDSVLLGYLSLAPDGFVPGLYLAPEARGQGVGRVLLAAAKRLAPDGIELTVFEPNRRALAFYLREGFRDLPERRETAGPEGLPVLRLRWEGEADG